jgi:two-component system, NtrC family, sensor histidine kinase HydH
MGPGSWSRRRIPLSERRMQRVLTSGPELAEQSGTMLAFARLRPSPASRPDEGAAPAWRGLRWPRREELFPVAYYGVVVAALALAGYPGWRIGVLALAATVQELNALTCPLRRNLKHCVNVDAEQMARIVVCSQCVLFATTGVTVAVTGGVRSPLLLTFVGAYLASVFAAGDRRATRALLGATALGVGALTLLPAAAAGPELPGAAHGFLAAASVLGVAALMAPVLAGMSRRRDALVRARKEMAADALARAQSLEEIGSKVAHELKNPLTGVKALVQLGLRSPAEAPSHDRLEVVEREVTRMQEILQNYLSFTRPLQGVRPRRVELAPLVSDTLVVLSGRADDAHVRLYAQGDATLEADPRRLKEALLNLVANAIEATPPGGEVVVDVRPSGDEIEIVIRDTGRGMAQETLRRIGTPFFTTRDDGTGLGVVLARSVIAQHGGSLRYDSEPGRGTQVQVTLPRVAAAARDAAWEGPCSARRPCR